MGLKIFLSFIFVMFAVVLLFVYGFVPIGTIEFASNSNSENSVQNNSKTENIQFYENLRFSSSEISYKIYDCPLKKKNDMQDAFDILAELTILEFHPVEFDEDISITCDSKNKIEEGLFIAGEGGPTNITKGEVFNVIAKGKILLIKDSDCENPNVALHELFHVLGFEHSDNPNDIMYPVSKCRQTISKSMVEKIDEIYSVPSLPDLVFGDVKAVMNGKYLDVNLSVRNDGVKDAGKAEILIYADEGLVKKIGLDELKIGYGRTIVLTNLWVKQINVEKLDFVIDCGFQELEKNNNRIKLG